MSDADELKELGEQVEPGWDSVPAAASFYDVRAILELDLYLRFSFVAALFPVIWLMVTTIEEAYLWAAVDPRNIIFGFVAVPLIFLTVASSIYKAPLRNTVVLVAVEGCGAPFLFWVAATRIDATPAKIAWYAIGGVCCVPGILGVLLQRHYLRQSDDAVVPNSCRRLLGRPFSRGTLVRLLDQACANERQAAWRGEQRGAAAPWTAGEPPRP